MILINLKGVVAHLLIPAHRRQISKLKRLAWCTEQVTEKPCLKKPTRKDMVEDQFPQVVL